ncbi:MAG: OmpA family protein [candidate division WOR-3 bacterium]|nr:MAG: OmpA family protein [candidate division WOR-3 bacterium]
MNYIKKTIPLIIILVLFFGCPKRQTEPEVVEEIPVEEEIPFEEVQLPEPEPEPELPPFVLETVFFDFDKSDIRVDGAEILQRNAEMLQLYPYMSITLEGHCCEIGTAEYNLALGERRALATREYLIMLGISADRMSTISYGEEKPLDPLNLERNRRCEFVAR